MIIYQTQEQWDNFGQKLCQIFDTEFKSTPAPEPIKMEKMSLSGELHPMFGLRHTEESRKQNSESIKRIMNTPEMKELNSCIQKISQNKPEVIEKKKKANEWRSTAIYGWHPEKTNNQLILFKSIRDFCQQTGSNRSVVYGILKGQYKQSFGWSCKYAI